MVSSGKPRRRRHPEEAEREIATAARRLLAERPSHDVTVSEIMRNTTLSRKSFYVYFRDRYELITRLIEPIKADRDASLDAFRRDRLADPIGAGRRCMRSQAQLWATHGRLLRTLAWSSEEDPEASRAWREFFEPVVRDFTEMITGELEAGRAFGLDPESTARALLGMNVNYFLDHVVGRPKPDVEATAEVLLTLWTRVIYAGLP